MSTTVHSPSHPLPVGALPASPSRSAQAVGPWTVVVSAWLLAVLLTVYQAPSVRQWLTTSGEGQEQGWTLAVGDALVALSEATGLAALRRSLEREEAESLVKPTQMKSPAAAIPPAPGSPAATTGPAAGAAPARRAGPIRRVLLVGASTIQFHLGAELERRLSASFPELRVVRLGKLSTGLTRPDVFDWPGQVRALLAQHDPDLVIANFGGNDAQAMVLDDGRVTRFGRPEWEAAYRERVRQVVTVARQGGAQVVLLGMTTTRDPALSRRMDRINKLTEEAGREAGALYLSTWDLGADARGNYQDVTVVDGVPVRTRLADGKHFSRSGAAFAAGKILDRLTRLVPIDGH